MSGCMHGDETACSRLPAVDRQHVGFVEDKQEVRCRQLADDQALSRLRLDALGDVHDEHHHVDDLGAADDGADEGRVSGAVHEGELDLIKRLPFLRSGMRRKRGGKDQILHPSTLA